jgi:hypothetical protein
VDRGRAARERSHASAAPRREGSRPLAQNEAALLDVRSTKPPASRENVSVARHLLSRRSMNSRHHALEIQRSHFLAACAATGLLLSGCSSAGGPIGSGTSAVTSITAPDPSSFTLPPSSAEARAQILAGYTSIDPGGVVPRGLLEDALEYFDMNQSLLPNPAYIAVVDFSQFSGNYRFFLVDMATGAVEQHKVAHGEGSDPDDTGYATIFSNTPGSYMSSLGFYMAADIYDGSHPNSMHIYGLSPDGSPNSMADTNVLARAVVVHPADYVSDDSSDAQGLSDGCFALDPNIELSIVQRLTNGALMYAETTPLNPPIGGGTTADGGVPSGDCALAGQGYVENTCTETLQCSGGSWVSRNSDPSSCATGMEASGACITDSGSVVPENTCTSTLQCQDGAWVDRSDDPDGCL